MVMAAHSSKELTMTMATPSLGLIATHDGNPLVRAVGHIRSRRTVEALVAAQRQGAAMVGLEERMY